MTVQKIQSPSNTVLIINQVCNDTWTMLCPNSTTFSPPNVLKRKTIGNQNSLSDLNTITSHHFNHLVSLVLPDVGTSVIPSNITDALVEDCDYYRIEDVNISDLIKKEFIDTFVKKGCLTALSDNTRIDTTNCGAITPTGHMVLVLNRLCYQRLGLEGKPSYFSGTPAARYVVHLDLKAQHFRPGKKNYERVVWCLTHGDHLKFDFLFFWEPPEENICPSSVAAYMSSLGYKVSVCHPKFHQRIAYNVPVPSLMLDTLDMDSSSELLEWLGIFSIEGDLDTGAPDSYINTYQTPEGSKRVGSVAYLQWTGFFTSNQISQLTKSLRDYVAERDDFPWISLYVQGFADSPVSWDLKEHYYYTSGENDYVIFFHPSGKYLLYTILSSNKKPDCKLSSKRNKK